MYMIPPHIILFMLLSVIVGFKAFPTPELREHLPPENLLAQ